METVALVDLFPVVVTAPDGAAYDSARVLVRSDYLWVFARSGQRVYFVRGVTLVGFDTATAQTDTTWQAVDDQGGTWQVRLGGGCGCGNPLKSWTAAALLALVP